MNESFLWHIVYCTYTAFGWNALMMLYLLCCIYVICVWLCGSSAALLWTALCQNTREQMGHGTFYLYTAWTLCVYQCPDTGNRAVFRCRAWWVFSFSFIIYSTRQVQINIHMMTLNIWHIYEYYWHCRTNLYSESTEL